MAWSPPSSTDTASAYIAGSHLSVPQLKLPGASPAAAGLSVEACQKVAMSLQDADSLLEHAIGQYDFGLAAAGECSPDLALHVLPVLVLRKDSTGVQASP